MLEINSYNPHPQTFHDLFYFYNNYVKTLYSYVQLNNVMPIEVMFEINAAFDHISRRWIYNEDEKKIVEKAFSHLKRSCLDIFKIKLKETFEQYNFLKKIDTSLIDNGKYHQNMLMLISEIKNEAIDARRLEGDKRLDDDSVKAFDRWAPVFEKCIIFEKEYYLNPKVEWAKQKGSQFSKKTFWLSVVASFIAGIITSLVFEFFKNWLFPPSS